MQTVIRNGRLITATTGTPIEQGTVVVDDDRIVAVGTEDAVATDPDARILDANGGTILPGLINLHDHVSRKTLRTPAPGLPFSIQSDALMHESREYLAYHTAHNILDELRAGVTCIRDFGLAGTTAITAKRAIEEGVLPGPLLMPAGSPICITGGHGSSQGSREADGPNEVRKAVRDQVKLGAECIKLMASGGLCVFPDEDPGTPELSVDEMRAGIAEAHRCDLLTAAHAYSNVAIVDAIEAGIDSIEHGAFLDDNALHMMRDRDVAYVPTMSGLIHIPYQYRASGRQDMYDLIMERFIDPLRKSVRMAADMGIRIGTGSDTAGDLVEELELLHEVTGYTTMQCIHAGTRVAANIAGVEKTVGTLVEGKQADILVVDGNPLLRIGDLRSPRWVIRAGELHDGAPLPLGVRMKSIGEEGEVFQRRVPAG